eukprot:ANDGO_00473.mRNA.1 hypothetical protein
MKREVFQLLESSQSLGIDVRHANAESDTASHRLENKITKSVIEEFREKKPKHWGLVQYVNPARSDKLLLVRWEREDQSLVAKPARSLSSSAASASVDAIEVAIPEHTAGAAGEIEGVSACPFPYAKFSRSVKIPFTSSEAVAAAFPSEMTPGTRKKAEALSSFPWIETEADISDFVGLCFRYHLSFPVIAESVGQSVEDCQGLFLALCRMLIPDASHPWRQVSDTFDLTGERKRKEMLRSFYARSRELEDEEFDIRDKLKTIENIKRKRLEQQRRIECFEKIAAEEEEKTRQKREEEEKRRSERVRSVQLEMEKDRSKLLERMRDDFEVARASGPLASMAAIVSLRKRFLQSITSSASLSSRITEKLEKFKVYFPEYTLPVIDTSTGKDGRVEWENNFEYWVPSIRNAVAYDKLRLLLAEYSEMQKKLNRKRQHSGSITETRSGGMKRSLSIASSSAFDDLDAPGPLSSKRKRLLNDDA